MPALFLVSGPKMGYSPPGATRCPDKREIWQGGLRGKYYLYRGKNVEIQPTKLSKFLILARNLRLRGDLLTLFLQIHQRLYTSTGSF